MRFLLVMDSILTLTIIQDFMSKRGHDIFRRRASHEHDERRNDYIFAREI